MLKHKPQASDTPIKRSIALISDLHIGSIYAIQPDPFITHDNRKLFPSNEQQQLNKVFTWCASVMKYWNCDTIIFMGDLIQGINKKDLGRQCITTDLEEQQDMATQMLKQICKKRQVCGISGTAYHKSIDTEAEKDILERLGGKFFNKMAWIKIKNSNRTLNISHQSANGRIYPVGALEREVEGMFKAYGKGKLPYKPDIIIRGHQHYFIEIHTPHYHAVIVPAFQTWYPYKTAYYGYNQPDIGIAMLFIDQKDRVIIHHYTTPLNIRIGDKTYEI